MEPTHNKLSLQIQIHLDSPYFYLLEWTAPLKLAIKASQAEGREPLLGP